MRAGLAGLTLIAAVLGACGERKAEPAGIGPWRFGHTTLGDVTGGLCQPTELGDGRRGTWCFAQTPAKIGSSTAEIDLYFLGAETSARLIEIQLKIRGCRESELEQYLRTGFGAPIESRPTRGYWKNSHLWVAALLPSEPARCIVHMLPLSENAEIERIKQR